MKFSRLHVPETLNHIESRNRENSQPRKFSILQCLFDIVIRKLTHAWEREKVFLHSAFVQTKLVLSTSWHAHSPVGKAEFLGVVGQGTLQQDNM